MRTRTASSGWARLWAAKAWWIPRHSQCRSDRSENDHEAVAERFDHVAGMAGDLPAHDVLVDIEGRLGGVVSPAVPERGGTST